MIRKWCHWCGKPSRGTALERRPTPVGWGMELGGRYASCGGCGTAFYATPEALFERDAEHEGGEGAALDAAADELLDRRSTKPESSRDAVVAWLRNRADILRGDA